MSLFHELLFNMNSDDMPTAPTLFDIFPVCLLFAELCIERVIEIGSGMPLRFVGDEIDMVATSSVFDGFDRVALK